jgi:hypothetical protein
VRQRHGHEVHAGFGKQRLADHHFIGGFAEKTEGCNPGCHSQHGVAVPARGSDQRDDDQAERHTSQSGEAAVAGQLGFEPADQHRYDHGGNAERDHPAPTRDGLRPGAKDHQAD